MTSVENWPVWCFTCAPVFFFMVCSSERSKTSWSSADVAQTPKKRLTSSPNLCSFLRFHFRTTSHSSGLVSDRNPSLHWPAEPEVAGGSSHCQSYERLFTAQVWHLMQQLFLTDLKDTPPHPSVLFICIRCPYLWDVWGGWKQPGLPSFCMYRRRLHILVLGLSPRWLLGLGSVWRMKLGQIDLIFSMFV